MSILHYILVFYSSITYLTAGRHSDGEKGCYVGFGLGYYPKKTTCLIGINVRDLYRRVLYDRASECQVSTSERARWPCGWTDGSESESGSGFWLDHREASG